MLASKFFDDVYYNNAYYARVGGISNIEVTPHASSLRPTPYLLLPTHYCQRTTALYFLLHSTSYCTTSYSLLPTHYFLLHSTSYSLLPTALYFLLTTALLRPPAIHIRPSYRLTIIIPSYIPSYHLTGNLARDGDAAANPNPNPSPNPSPSPNQVNSLEMEMLRQTLTLTLNLTLALALALTLTRLTR